MLLVDAAGWMLQGSFDGVSTRPVRGSRPITLSRIGPVEQPGDAVEGPAVGILHR
jgi:hypothetical protein